MLRMLPDVQQVTIRPVIEAAVAKGALVHTDEYDVYARLEEWGYGHKTVCHARGEYARDEACNYPQVAFAMAAPSLMSMRRDHPRHITVLPGGGSEARAR